MHFKCWLEKMFANSSMEVEYPQNFPISTKFFEVSVNQA
jgi:hypothetical protein